MIYLSLFTFNPTTEHSRTFHYDGIGRTEPPSCPPQYYFNTTTKSRGGFIIQPLHQCVPKNKFCVEMGLRSDFREFLGYRKTISF